MEREYFTELYEGVIIYVYFRTIKGEVTDFVVKLLAHCEDKWHEILRYDSGHDCPHKDILSTDGKVIRKVWYDFLDNTQALTMAITDIKENCEVYKQRYQKWLKGQ